MAAEFYINFKDASWVSGHKEAWIDAIQALATCVQSNDDAYWLQGLEDRGSPGRWRFDVRIFITEKSPVLLEISAHPPSIEHDLKHLFSWLRSRTLLSIDDEDGEPSGW